MTRVFVQNVARDYEPSEPCLSILGYTFVKNAKGKFVGETRRNGQIYSSDGHDDDGTTPGDPEVSMPAPRPGNSGRFRPPINPAERDVFDPQPGHDLDQITCPSCGYAFSQSSEKPLVLPTMNFRMAGKKPVYVPSGSDPDDFSDAGDDGRMTYRRTDSVMPSEHQCPHCGSVFVGTDEIGDGGGDQRML